MPGMIALLDIHDLMRIFKLGRTATYRLTHSPDFPPPLVISPGCYRWREADLQAYLDSRTRAIPAASPQPASAIIEDVYLPRRRRSGGAR